MFFFGVSFYRGHNIMLVVVVMLYQLPYGEGTTTFAPSSLSILCQALNSSSVASYSPSSATA